MSSFIEVWGEIVIPVGLSGIFHGEEEIPAVTSLVDYEDLILTEVDESRENVFQEMDIADEILPEELINTEIDDSAVEDFGRIDVNMVLKFDEEQLCDVNLQCNGVVNTGGNSLSECLFERGENSALADLYRREFFCREEVRTRLEPLVRNMWCLKPWEVQPCGSKYEIKLFSRFYYLPPWWKNFPEGQKRKLERAVETEYADHHSRGAYYVGGEFCAFDDNRMLVKVSIVNL